MSGRFIRVLLALLAVAVGGAILPFGSTAAVDAQSSPDRIVHFLVDVSGSMATNNRLESAKAALRSIVPTLPSDTWAGMRTFGTSGCGLNLDVPPGPIDAATFTAAVDPLRPAGSTPLAAGLAAAAADLTGLSAPEKSIILMADGDNNCGGDPCQVAREIAASGTNLIVNTAGIQVSGSARQTLECIAQATGGAYVDVSDPSDIEVLLGGFVGGLQLDLTVRDVELVPDPGPNALVELEITVTQSGSPVEGAVVEKTRNGRTVSFTTNSTGILRLYERVDVASSADVAVTASSGASSASESIVLYDVTESPVCRLDGRPERLNALRTLLDLVGVPSIKANFDGWIQGAVGLAGFTPQRYQTQLRGHFIHGEGLTPFYELRIVVTDKRTGVVVSSSDLFSRRREFHSPLYGTGLAPLQQWARQNQCGLVA